MSIEVHGTDAVAPLNQSVTYALRIGPFAERAGQDVARRSRVWEEGV